jgi:hypothetical protein
VTFCSLLFFCRALLTPDDYNIYAFLTLPDCYSISGTGILIASKSDRPGRPSGLDLFEWIPEDQKLLLAHLEADGIVGVTDNLPGQPWYILYSHLNACDRVSATLGATIMESTFSSGTLPPVYQISAIPTEYNNNLRKCYIQGNTSATLGEFKRMWAHTKSDELVFMEDGVLQWSIPFTMTVQKL